MSYRERRFKHKLYTDEDGEPQVAVVLMGSQGNIKFWRDEISDYWRADGTVNLLGIMASDPANGLHPIAEGMWSESKF